MIRRIFAALLAIIASIIAPKVTFACCDQPITPFSIGGLGQGVAIGMTQPATGTGGIVLSNSPTLVTPNLGTPSFINLSHATGIPSAPFPGLTGDVTVAYNTTAATVQFVAGHAAALVTALGNATTGSGSIVLAAAPTLTGFVQNTGVATPTNLYTSPPSNLAATDGAGAYISISSLSGHVTGDSLRVGDYHIVTTQYGVSGQEYSGWYELNNSQGDNPNWLTNHSYVAGAVVNTSTGVDCSPDSENLTDCVYTETVASCTSAASGTGPSGHTTNIVDNTCGWNWAGYQINTGKTALGIIANGLTGGGPMWGWATNVINNAGYDHTMFSVGAELDRTFNDGDHTPGNPGGQAYGLIGQGSALANDQGTFWIAVSNGGATNPLYHDGYVCLGATTISDNCFVNSSNTSGGGFVDNAPAGANAFSAQGSYTGAAFDALSISSAVALRTCTGCAAIRDVTNGASTMYFDVSTGGSTAGAFTWRDKSTYNSMMTLNSTGLSVTGIYVVNATNGVSCSAGTVSLVTEVVTGGIVTHC